MLGEYIYFLEVFGTMHKFFGPILAFIYVWVTAFLRRPMIIAALSLSFAKYSTAPILKAFEFCPDSYLEAVLSRLIACVFASIISVFGFWFFHNIKTNLKSRPCYVYQLLLSACCHKSAEYFYNSKFDCRWNYYRWRILSFGFRYMSLTL